MAGFIAFVCAALVGAFGTKFLVLNGKTKFTRLREKAEKAGCVTKGRYFDSDYQLPSLDYRDYSYPRFASSATSRPWTHIEYEYFVDGKPYRCNVAYPEILGHVGDHPHEINVYYDPKNPAKCVAGNVDVRGKQRQSGCYLTLLLMIITFGVVLNVAMRLFNL